MIRIKERGLVVRGHDRAQTVRVRFFRRSETQLEIEPHFRIIQFLKNIINFFFTPRACVNYSRYRRSK